MTISEKKHVYDYEVKIGADTAPARVIAMVGLGKRVLEVGSGPGAITRILSTKNNCAVTALEVDPLAIEIVKQHCQRVVSADLNDPQWVKALGVERFQVVIAADVLEHVYRPLDVLTGMKSLLSDDGQIIVSLPHVGHAGMTGSLLTSNFEYREWGLLDKTHIRFFGLTNIDSLFSNAGLAITRVEFVVRHPLETEFAPLWTSLSTSQQNLILSTPSSYVYQAVVCAVPSEQTGSKLMVVTTPIPTPASRIRWMSIAKTMIPSPIKRFIKKLIIKS
jgi:SAM-dependent methyltransferase